MVETMGATLADDRRATDVALARCCERDLALLPHDIAEAIRYSLLGGGKRLRAVLVAGAYRAAGGEGDPAALAAAVEIVHAYSLVHDDLPCMDDDDLRRGQPTTHKKFDEATAVLAGDALLTLAFELLVDPATHASAEVRCALAARLGQAAGSEGMIGGQMVDIEAETRAFGNDETILLQRMKTGALFEFSCEAGPILAGRGEDDRRRLRDYARDIGLAFQIVDDLIDVTGTAEKAGKQVGKDQAQGKATLVSLYGVDGARAEARRLAERAVETLSPYGDAADQLRALPFYLLDRES